MLIFSEQFFKFVSLLLCRHSSTAFLWRSFNLFFLRFPIFNGLFMAYLILSVATFFVAKFIFKFIQNIWKIFKSMIRFGINNYKRHLPLLGSILMDPTSNCCSSKISRSLFSTYISVVSSSTLIIGFKNFSCITLDFWYNSWKASIIDQHPRHTKFGNQSDSLIYLKKKTNKQKYCWDLIGFIEYNLFVYFAFKVFTDNFTHLHFDADNTEYIHVIKIVNGKAQTAVIVVRHRDSSIQMERLFI